MTAFTSSQAVANEVRGILARNRKTQLDLAADTGMAIHALRRRMSGEVPFSVPELVAIANSLGVAPSSLMEGVA